MAVTRTAITENPGVIPVARSSGQFLRHTVLVSGPVPLFVQSDENGCVAYTPFLHTLPAFSFVWDNYNVLKDPELLNTAFSFFSNPNYTYKVELMNATGEPLWTMFEIQYRGDAKDTVEESFRILAQ